MHDHDKRCFMRYFIVCIVLMTVSTGCDSELAQKKAAGNILFNQGDYVGAQAHYESALDIDHEDLGAHILLGNAYIEQKKYHNAKKHFQWVLNKKEDSPEAHRGMMFIIAHQKTGDHAFASYLRHAQALLKNNPKDKETLIATGMILSESANKDDKENFLKAQLEAEKYFKQVLPIDDRDPKLLFHLALVYARQNKLETALRVVDRIAQVVPRPGFASYTKAVVFDLTNNKDKALKEIIDIINNKRLSEKDMKQLLAPSSYLASFANNSQIQALQNNNLTQ